MNAPVHDAGEFVFGTYRLDPVRRVLTRDAEPVKLSARLFDTLLFLVRNAGRVVTKDELLTAVWGSRVVEEANLSQAIFSLRKVLASKDGAELIVTAPGKGYRFAASVYRDVATDQMPALSESVLLAETRDRVRAARPAMWWALAAVSAAAVVTGLVLRWPNAAQAPAAPAGPPPHSIAVLAFTNMSGDPSQDYFGDGVSEELINALARLPALRVAARVSAFSFKGTHATIQDIGAKLNVGDVLEGSVRRDAGIVRITAQLIDTRSGYQLWSRSFDRPPGDLLDVEGEIASSVATSLQVSVVQGEAARLTLGGSSNPAAFDSYLRGMLLLRSNDDGAFLRARDDFDTAIRLDPGYARAYAGRAFTLCDIGLNPPSEYTDAEIASTYASALQSADRAIALAPELATAHAARAVVLENGFVRLADAASEIARARDLEPGNAAVVGSYAQVEADLGHFDKAVDAAKLATALDPLRPDAWYILGYILYSARRFDQSRASLLHEKSLRGLLPEHSMEVEARDELLEGRFADADRSCRATSASYRDVCLAMADHALGRSADAHRELARLLAARGGADYNLAEVYAQWHDVPLALDCLEKAARAHDPNLGEIRSDPLLDPIREEPRFRAVEQSLHLPS